MCGEGEVAYWTMPARRRQDVGSRAVDALTRWAFDDVGFHRVVGRTSIDIIKSGGYKIGAGEVETAILGHPGVREAAVVGVDDDDLGQRVVAYVVADDVDASAITDFLAGLLTTHKRPREIRFVDSLPRNAMGKVQKSKLT